MSIELLDTLWVLTAGALVFFMQAGFAFLESGLTRSKNSINVAIKNLTDLGVSLVCFWLFGFAFMFGRSISGIIGGSGFLLQSAGDLWVAAFFFFQAMFCSTAATIVSGAVAERMRYSSYIVATILLSSIIYPVFGHWAWGGFLTGEVNGWLGQLGFVDFAGSTVVHSVGGWIALAALIIIGPRAGRFPDQGPPRQVPGSSIPMAVVGVIILWFGWFGFNGGSTLAMNDQVPIIITNTALAAGAGMIAALAVGWPIYKKPDVSLVLNGSLAGLVAITAPCAYVTELEAVLIGAIGSVIMLGSVFLLERVRIDDAVGAVPVHLFAGIWGTLAVAAFGDLKLIGTGLSRLEQFGVQALGVGSAAAWAFGLAFLFLFIFDKFQPLRVTAEDEVIGLNVVEHGASTEIFDLYQTLEVQAQTGDTSLRVPVEPFTEVGQIAKRYNEVMDSLQDNLVAKSEYLSILDNVSDALFLIDRELQVGPYYSAATRQILRLDEPAAGSFERTIVRLLPEDAAASVVDFLNLLFDPAIETRTLMKLNPLAERELFFDDGRGGFESRFLRFSFVRVGSEKHIDRVMVIARDATSEVELNKAVESARKETQSEMELLYRMIHVEPSLLHEFIESADEQLRSINRQLGHTESDLEARLDVISRDVHSVKGDAQLFDLGYIAEQAEAFERRIAEIRREPEIKSEHFVSLAVRLTELQRQIDRTRDLVDRLASFQVGFAAQNATGRDIIPMSLESLVERLSSQLGKKVVLDTEDFDPSHLPAAVRRKVRDVLVQLARNALYHGIEDPATRAAQNKLEQGLIKIASHIENGSVIIRIRDDGRGLQAKLLREQAVARGLISRERAGAVSSKELVQLMFVPGVSTAAVPGDKAGEHAEAVSVAGRGYGMAVVKEKLAEIGSKIKISTRSGEFMEFSLIIPANS
ncbi:MAG: ammonium transporter [Spirochaetales bacterium]